MTTNSDNSKTKALRSEELDGEALLEGANRAVRMAIERLHARQIATVHVIDGQFVRIHPDGRREVFDTLAPL